MNRRLCFTLAEVMVGLMVTTLLLLSTMAVLSAAARGMARSQTVVDTTRQARQGMEATLTLIRSANAVLPVAILHGVEYRTNANTVVLRAPAYDTTQSLVFPSNSWDLIALEWSPTERVLRQSVHRAIGSERPQSNRRIIARNVESAQWILKVRDKFDWTRPSNPPLLQTFQLNMLPSTIEGCWVNGVAGSISIRDQRNVWIPTPSLSGLIQFVYAVDPSTFSGTAPTKVSQVEMRMTVMEVSGTAEPVRTVVEGQARLRNYRQ